MSDAHVTTCSVHARQMPSASNKLRSMQLRSDSDLTTKVERQQHNGQAHNVDVIFS